MTTTIMPGRPAPLGATCGPDGTNFAVSSNGEQVTLCLFADSGAETRLALPERDGDIWHGFVPGVGEGQAYGFRVSGPYDRARGLRYNPAKLLLDPYARAIDGECWFGPESLDYATDDTAAPSLLDSAGHMPRGLVTAPLPPVPPAPGPGHPLADTIIYEVHVRGFTATHPDVPPELRGTYAGLAHEAALDFLMLVNSWWEPLTFTVPAELSVRRWDMVCDSFDPSRTGTAGRELKVGPRSTVVLRSPP
jgi:glycogen operon protein